MDLENSPANSPSSSRSRLKPNRDVQAFIKISLILLSLTIAANFFVIVEAGHRGVLMQFGKVEERVLGEGLHLIVPLVNTVKKLSVQVQNQEISAEASSKDLQDVFADVALNWHILPEKANVIFQQIGDFPAITAHLLNPAVEEVLKAVIAQYTAEEIITKRGEVKQGVDSALTNRLATYNIAVDDISLVHIHFSQRFRDAVEAKQIAEQEAKRAEFVALKAAKEAEAKINQAKGEAEAQRLVQQTLTPDLLKKQAIERWNGKLPLVMGKETTKALFNLSQFIEEKQVGSEVP